MPDKKSGKSGESSKSAKDAETLKAEEILRNLNMNDFQQIVSNLGNPSRDARDMSKHKFWQTQPVPRFDDDASKSTDGPIEPDDLDKVPKEPFQLIDGFEWETMDMTSQKDIDDVYQLLYNNYVEDSEAMFRFKYSASFLNWALKSPGWRKEWHIGIRTSTSKKLVAFVSGVPITLRVREQKIQCSEVNFLNVHKKLRSKRLAPVLIREITRRCNLVGIWQAIYTSGTFLPTPVSTCRYFHRSIDWPKLHDVGFSPLPAGSTKQRQVARYKLPERTSIEGLRPMESKDIPAVQDLLQRYLDRTDIAQHFTEEEVSHWLLNEDPNSPEKVVWTYVIEQGNKITDFFSFYCLESTVIGHPKHDTIRAAYLFYYATEEAFKSEGDVKGALKKRLNDLVQSALIIARDEKFDVFNALTLMDNPLFLNDQKFGPGDGRLHYYLYNYRTAPIMGGVDENNTMDVEKMGGVGVVML